MNLKSSTTTAGARISRARFNPIRNLRPETLASALDAFEAGRLGAAARIFEAVMKRDDAICGLNLKRKKSVGRLEGQVVSLEDSAKADTHKKALKEFYDNIEVCDAVDGNERGGVKLLVSQMMDAVGMRYAVHKVDFMEKNGGVGARFTKYPLWLFENTSGRLRILEREGHIGDGEDLPESEWMISCSDGLMFASSIAYLFKQLPLRDWLIYCERNGMPGIKASTDAFPGTQQWEAACQAVSDFGAEFHAVLSQGTTLEAVDVSTRGQLPYPALIERMDRMLCALWRGGDLSTMSGSGNFGASVQEFEGSIIEEQDAANIGDTLNRQIDTQVIKILFGEDERPLAKFKLRLPDYELHKGEIEIIERLCALGLKPDAVEMARRFAFPLEKKDFQDEL